VSTVFPSVTSMRENVGILDVANNGPAERKMTANRMIAGIEEEKRGIFIGVLLRLFQNIFEYDTLFRQIIPHFLKFRPMIRRTGLAVFDLSAGQTEKRVRRRV
jgi:hypothetical protein